MDYGLINTRTVYFNSSFLFDPERGLTQTYAKQHLVIFGEYIPLDDVYPWLRRLAPIEESFTAGSVQTVFRLDTSPRAFAVLICFEDTVAALARRAVRAGARLLVNQTNDAWFDPSWASRQHMLQCVFRCVENRVPAVRSTNTGITCYIDRTGRVIASLPPTRGQNQPPECLAQTVLLPGPEMPLTFYTRHGDWFAWVCLGLAALALLAAWKMGPDQKISA
jgi:apolipoprotein N-acyltransferase